MPAKGEGEPRLTEEAVYRAAVEAFGRGLKAPDVAAVLGLSERCVQLWLKKGKRAEAPIYVRFLRDVRRAEGELLQKRLKRMEEHGEGNWQALWKLLQAQRPRLYGDQRKEIADLRKEMEELKKGHAQLPPAPDPLRPAPPQEPAGGGE